jgi:hypothetical protein
MAGTRTIAEQWRFPSLLHYYDFREECLVRQSNRLLLLGDTGLSEALASVIETVSSHVAVLDDKVLPKVAASIADDLYKSANALEQWGPAQRAYVTAVWGTFFTCLMSRGFTLHYVIDNQFPEHLQRPLQLFPDLFGSAGLVYLCPHYIALSLPETAQAEPSVVGLRPLVEEARHIAAAAAEQLNKRRPRRHLIYLELDYEQGCLESIVGLGEKPGSISIFRNEPGIQGTSVQLKIVPKRPNRSRKATN